MAQLCAAQKLLYADAIAPANTQNAAEALMMDNTKPCSCEGVMGQESAPYNRVESTRLLYMRVLVRPMGDEEGGFSRGAVVQTSTLPRRSTFTLNTVKIQPLVWQRSEN